MRAWMTEQLHGRPPVMGRLARRAAIALIALALVGVSAPVAWAADGLTLTSQYPGVVVGPGSHVSFDINVKTTTAARVGLSISGVPSNWYATLTGGGFVVSEVQTDGKNAVTVRLDVVVPDAATGTTTLNVTGTAGGQTVVLPLDITVQAQAGGNVQLTTDTPSVQGASTSNFSFNVSIHNNTPADLTFAVSATGPSGWTVDAKFSSSSQAATSVVTAGAVGAVTVTATPPQSVAAGSYQVNVVATAGGKQYTQQLGVNVTGSYTLAMSTPDQVLSNQGNTGTATEQQLLVTNNGTAAVTNVNITDSVPTNWTVTFDQSSIKSIPPGQSVTVTAKITPSSDAITGDYQLTFTATSDQSSTANVAIRFTVQTSIIGAVVGVALIVLVFVGLWWVFRRYGRR